MRGHFNILVLILTWSCWTQGQIFNTKEELLNFLRLKNQGKSQQEALALSSPHIPAHPSLPHPHKNVDEITTFKPFSQVQQNLRPEDEEEVDAPPKEQSTPPRRRLRVRPTHTNEERDEGDAPKRVPGRRRLSPIRARLLSGSRKDAAPQEPTTPVRLTKTKSEQFRRRQFTRPQRVKAQPQQTLEDNFSSQEEIEKAKQVDRDRFPAPSFAKSAENTDHIQTQHLTFEDTPETAIFSDFDDLPSDNTPIRTESPPTLNEEPIRLNRPIIRISPQPIVDKNKQIHIHAQPQRSHTTPAIHFNTLGSTEREPDLQTATPSLSQFHSTTQRPQSFPQQNPLDHDDQPVLLPRPQRPPPRQDIHNDDASPFSSRKVTSESDFLGQVQRGNTFSVQRVPVRRVHEPLPERSQLQNRRTFNIDDFPEKQGIHQVITPPPENSVQVNLNEPKDEPVKTLRRYSHENSDGSFTFGYESSDGSFKEETRGVDCVVRGKYGYIDPDGVKREFTYVSGNPCDPENQDSEEEEDEQSHRFQEPPKRRPLLRDEQDDEEQTFPPQRQQFLHGRPSPKEHSDIPININRSPQGNFHPKPQFFPPPPAHTSPRPIATTQSPRPVTPTKPFQNPSPPTSVRPTPHPFSNFPPQRNFPNAPTFSEGQPLIPFGGSIGVQPGIPVRFQHPLASPPERSQSRRLDRPEEPIIERPKTTKFEKPKGSEPNRKTQTQIFGRPPIVGVLPQPERHGRPIFERPEETDDFVFRGTDGLSPERSERPAFNRPERPAFDRLERPTFDRPERPAFDRPERPTFDRPERPAFDRPERPTFDRPEKTAFDRPERPTFDRPDSPPIERPNLERPIFNGQERNIFGRQEGPSFDKPERPVRPKFKVIERPGFERSENTAFNGNEGPENSRFEETQRPRFPISSSTSSPRESFTRTPASSTPFPVTVKAPSAIPPFPFSEVSRPTIERVPSILVSNTNRDEDARRNPSLAATGFDFDKQLADLGNQRLHLAQGIINRPSEKQTDSPTRPHHQPVRPSRPEGQESPEQHFPSVFPLGHPASQATERPDFPTTIRPQGVPHTSPSHPFRPPFATGISPFPFSSHLNSQFPQRQFFPPSQSIEKEPEDRTQLNQSNNSEENEPSRFGGFSSPLRNPGFPSSQPHSPGRLEKPDPIQRPEQEFRPQLNRNEQPGVIQEFERGQFSPFVQDLFGSLNRESTTPPPQSPFDAFAQRLQLRL